MILKVENEDSINRAKAKKKLRRRINNKICTRVVRNIEEINVVTKRK